MLYEMTAILTVALHELLALVNKGLVPAQYLLDAFQAFLSAMFVIIAIASKPLARNRVLTCHWLTQLRNLFRNAHLDWKKRNNSTPTSATRG